MSQQAITITLLVRTPVVFKAHRSAAIRARGNGSLLDLGRIGQKDMYRTVIISGVHMEGLEIESRLGTEVSPLHIT